jgi:hypothetical protein
LRSAAGGEGGGFGMSDLVLDRALAERDEARRRVEELTHFIEVYQGLVGVAVLPIEAVPRLRGVGSPIDLAGWRFGRLVAIARSGRAGKGRHIYWVCRCDCGVETEARGDALLNGYHLSCGCHRVAASAERATRQSALQPRVNGHFVAFPETVTVDAACDYLRERGVAADRLDGDHVVIDGVVGDRVDLIREVNRHNEPPVAISLGVLMPEVEPNLGLAKKCCAWCGGAMPADRAHKVRVKYCNPRCQIAAQNDRYLRRQRLIMAAVTGAIGVEKEDRDDCDADESAAEDGAAG